MFLNQYRIIQSTIKIITFSKYICSIIKKKNNWCININHARDCHCEIYYKIS